MSIAQAKKLRKKVKISYAQRAKQSRIAHKRYQAPDDSFVAEFFSDDKKWKNKTLPFLQLNDSEN